MATLLATVPALASVWLLLWSVGSVRNTVRTITSKYIAYDYSGGYCNSNCMATPKECRNTVIALANVWLLIGGHCQEQYCCKIKFVC